MTTTRIKMISTTGNDLAGALTRLGVNVTTVGDSEIGGHCPVHADNSPSWSMNINTGLWICYACGATGNLSQLALRLSVSSDEAMLLNQFIIESGLESLKATGVGEEVFIPKADVDTYRGFQPVPEQLLKSRGMDASVAHRYGLRWDPQPRHWIVPIVSPSGELWGWQAKGRGYFRNVPVGVNKSRTLFGLDRFRARTAVLVESPLDVVRVASARLGIGVGGLASFGAHVSHTQMSLLSGRADIIVIALDNDTAGITAAKRVHDACPRPRGGISFLRYEHTNAKDIGEMTDDELEEAVTKASAVPWWVQ
jgi:hypothetical protein|tara:strand:- start:7698 stop:8624 length:927 start_codon:yes stop_codon:yes gene_type:complete